MSLQKLQNKIEKAAPLKLPGLRKIRKESLQEFLVKFLTDWNNKKPTVYVSSGRTQTPPRKRRSLGDIFLICKYYYPNLKLEDLIVELYVKLPGHFNKGYRSSYCFAMNKRTFYYDPYQQNAIYNKTHNDEYGHHYKYYLEQIKAETPIEFCEYCELRLDSCICDLCEWCESDPCECE